MRSLAWLVVPMLFWSSLAAAQSPRVALVVLGDPAETVVRATTELEASLAASGSLTLPADEAVRGALRGEPGTAEDGLEELRGLRRRLGISTEGDREVLDTIATRLELVVLVVVRGAEQPTAKVYDASEHRYFTGEAVLDVASAESARQFIVARAAAAERRRLGPTPEATAQTTAEPATTEPDPAAPVEAPPRRSFMRRNWPFFVAGALLIGTTTFFLVQRGQNDTSPPVIHIRPAGN